MAENGADPSMKDVMEMLNKINNKIDKRQNPEPPPSPAKRPRPDPMAPAPLSGSWASSDVIERVLYKQCEVRKRVEELARQISLDYVDATEDSFVVVGLMAGVYMFIADLSRGIQVPHMIDFASVSSYGLETISSANVKIKKDTDQPVEGKDVLIVDEMCDSGRTLACVKKLFQDRGAKSVKTCALLDKHERREAEIHLDYVGFKCEDHFVVGYGMDWANRFRSLADIVIVRKSAYQK